MTDSQPLGGTLDATEGAEGTCGHCEAREAAVAPREHWQFLGRERHYGFDYLIFILAANPKEPNTLGKRWARVVG